MVAEAVAATQYERELCLSPEAHGQAMPTRTAEANAAKYAVRAGLEHVFAYQERG